MIYLLLFYKPIRGSSGGMHSCMFLSPVDLLFRQSTYLSCACQRGTSWGWLVEAASPPIFLLMCPSRLDIWTVWFCLFLKFVFTKPWPFGKILRTPLRYWGLPFQFMMYFSGVFWWRLQSCRIIFSHCHFLYDILRFFFWSIFMMFYALVTGLSIIWTLVWWRFCGIFLVLHFPVMTGAPKFLDRTDLQLQATSR